MNIGNTIIPLFKSHQSIGEKATNQKHPQEDKKKKNNRKTEVHQQQTPKQTETNYLTTTAEFMT